MGNLQAEAHIPVKCRLETTRAQVMDGCKLPENNCSPTLINFMEKVMEISGIGDRTYFHDGACSCVPKAFLFLLLPSAVNGLSCLHVALALESLQGASAEAAGSQHDVGLLLSQRARTSPCCWHTEACLLQDNLPVSEVHGWRYAD